VTSYWPTASVQPRCLVYVELCPLMARARSCIRRWLTGVHLVYKALVVRDGVVSRRVGVYCMYWTTARHKPLSLALPVCTLTDVQITFSFGSRRVKPSLRITVSTGTKGVQARSHAMITCIHIALESRPCSLTVARRKQLGVLLRGY
jgi:hypothetical protein